MSGRISGLLKQVLGYQEAITFVLAFLTILTVILSVEAADWITPMPSLAWIAVVGALLGLWAARARRWVLLYHVAALGLGGAFLLAATAAVVDNETFIGGVVEVVSRTRLWVSAIAAGGASTDRIPVGLFLGALGWLMSYLTMYLAIRKPSFLALVPAGMVLISNLTYLPTQFAPWLFFYLLIAVLLLTNMLYRSRLAQWERQGVQARGPLGLHLLHSSFWFAVLVFSVSFFLPEMGAGPGPVREAWNRMRAPLTGVEDDFNRVLSSVPAKKDIGIYTFGSTLPFRGEIRLGDNTAFYVSSPVEIYWRGRMYDRYESWGWGNSEGLKSYETSVTGDIASLSSYPARQQTTVTFTPQGDTRHLLFPGEPLKVNVPAHALVRAGVAGNAPAEIVNLESKDFVGPEKTYQVQSLVPNVTEQQLRGDAAAYPRWVLERYLRLPDSLPARVKDLANQLAAGQQNRWDKVSAIQGHVRSISYNQLVPAPPAGQDGVDYFLFDAREGYSDYHASALAVLLRAAGIPARMVAGYLPGDWDAEKQAFVVTDADAHGWTEAYFPQYGWISLEPVGGRPPLVRPIAGGLGRGETVEVPTPDPATAAVPNGALIYGDEDEIFGEDIGDLEPLPNEWGKSMSGVLLFLGGVALGSLVVSQTAVRLLARVRSPRRTYVWLGRTGRMFGFGPRRYETPYEYGQRLQGLAPECAAHFHEIAHRYSLATYARRRADEPLARLPWGGMMWGLLRARFNKLQSPPVQPLPTTRRAAFGL